jgi:hypothetical protein
MWPQVEGIVDHRRVFFGGYSFRASLPGAARTGETDEDFHLSMVGLSKTRVTVKQPAGAQPDRAN